MTRQDPRALARYGLRLFVAGDGALSRRAVAELRGLCKSGCPVRCELEVVDVFEEPEKAAAAGIFAVPTLMRVRPAPSVRVVGDLVEREAILSALGLVAPGSGPAFRGGGGERAG